MNERRSRCLITLTSDHAKVPENGHCFRRLGTHRGEQDWTSSKLPRFVYHHLSLSTRRLCLEVDTEKWKRKIINICLNLKYIRIYLSSYDIIGIYLKIIVMRLVAKPFPIYGERCYVSTFVIHNDNTFPWHGDIFWRRKSIWCFQRSQKIAKGRVYKNWSIWKENIEWN